MTSTAEANKIRVFCVDDNPMVAQAVNLTIRSKAEEEIDFVGSADSVDALLESTGRSRWTTTMPPNIVLLDIDIPGRDAFDSIPDIEETCRDNGGRPRIIMYSGLLEKRLVDRAGLSHHADLPEDGRAVPGVSPTNGD